MRQRMQTQKVPSSNRETFEEILHIGEQMDTIENVGNVPTSTEREPDMSFPRKESWRLLSESKGPKGPRRKFTIICTH